MSYNESDRPAESAPFMNICKLEWSGGFIWPVQ